GKDNTPAIMPYVSFAMFFLLFSSVYVEMRVLAFKEKRPQYGINPPPFKGLLYGFIGIVPLVLVQVLLIVLAVPADYAVLKQRVLQGFTGPLYWFARLLGNAPVDYVLSLVWVVVFAGIGYFAGHKDFLISAYLRQKLGIKATPKKRPSRR
ncbi:MAG: hypothetical protein N2376_03135, partial [Clostridia bacterium]|nr:hypothetical protein [Clostridia bacterium]